MDPALSLSLVGFILLSFAALVWLLLLALNIWMLVDAVRRRRWNSELERLTWIALLALGIPMAFGTVISIVYYFAVYRTPSRA